ncbi:hypothetical protein DSUL_90025 [Desulfovibrionales bacterium]
MLDMKNKLSTKSGRLRPIAVARVDKANVFYKVNLLELDELQVIDSPVAAAKLSGSRIMGRPLWPQG